ncbi:hypothetical protein ABPG74_012258 [Tetrahymena malaccensis]
MHSSVHTVDSVQSQRIVHDQINSSHSKQQFSFPKQERFLNNKKSYCQSAAYELGSQLNKRSTGLGFGYKSDFTKGDLDKPGPDRYSVISIFEVENSKKKGFTFSLGREKIKFRQILPSKITPGPGQYEVDDSKKSRKYLYSMGQRTVYPFSISTSKSVPGPDAYDIEGMNKTGSYFVSKYSGSKASVFAPPTSTRFSYMNRNKYIPGPGAYSYETFTQIGKYHNSKLRSVAGGKFSQEGRSNYVCKDAILSPGPGAYRVLSEFGDTDFPPINGSPKMMNKLSKAQSLSSFKHSQSTRANQQYSEQKGSQKNLKTQISSQNGAQKQKSLENQV